MNLKSDNFINNVDVNDNNTLRILKYIHLLNMLLPSFLLKINFLLKKENKRGFNLRGWKNNAEIVEDALTKWLRILHSGG